jgi:hypothetical protein
MDYPDCRSGDVPPRQLVCGSGSPKDERECVYPGVDPDVIGSWCEDYDDPDSDPDSGNNVNANCPIKRYQRGWPGWASVNVLEAAGLVMTRDKVHFGSPRRGAVGSEVAQYNDTYAGLQPYQKGFWSDPMIYDGRVIFWSGPRPTDSVPTSTGTEVFFHDDLVARGKMGCSDFMAVLSNGNTTVKFEMPFDAGFTGTPTQRLALFSLTQRILEVTTELADIGGGSDFSHQLAGAWVAQGANFGTFTPPVMLIGAPAIKQQECDHTYLLGETPIPQRTYLSFVEDETLPPGF